MRQAISLFLAGSIVAAMLLTVSASGQPTRQDKEMDHGLPDLKASQVEDLLKNDKKKSIEDAAEILEQATALKDELERNDKHVLSLASIKRAEEIEKLAKRIRGRMKRF